jgi:MEDS: MEthanogen/methylotroph, DcmR Sensory domain
MKSSSAPGHLHAVTFYDTAPSLWRMVADFIGEGLNVAEPALIIATVEHRAGICAELRARHLDPEWLQRSNEMLLLDASDTLNLFMSDGMPDPGRFADVASAALAQLCRGRKRCTIRAYGEMVDVLWKLGQDAAAIRLEMLWNKLALTNEFSLLCGYSMGNFYKEAGRNAIHHQHTHTVSEHGHFVPCSSPMREAQP